MCCEPRLQHACTSTRALTQHQLIPPCSQGHANHRYPTSSYSYRRSIDKLSILACNASTASSERGGETVFDASPDALTSSVSFVSPAACVSPAVLFPFGDNAAFSTGCSCVGTDATPCVRLDVAALALLGWVSGTSFDSVVMAGFVAGRADTLGCSVGFGEARADARRSLRTRPSLVSCPERDSAGTTFFHVDT